MVLGFDNTALLTAVVFAAVVLKPRQLRLLGRNCGRTVGWAVGHISLLRKEIAQSTGKSGVANIHREVQDSLSMLNNIQYEIRRGTQLFPQSTTPEEKPDQPKEHHAPTSAPPEPLPVSAEEIGTLKKKISEGKPRYGSDIVLEALIEEEVALQAKRFMKTGDSNAKP